MSAVPTTFGKYFLTEKIATGGMAEIYLAKLLGPGGFEKLLIIKQIHPQFGDLPEFVELFVREAKTLVALSHSNIVPVYELGVLEGTYFIAMEYIDGPTLAELLDASAPGGAVLEPAIAAFICAEVLKGLDYAHRKGAGVIHRDLSPRNVMLSRDGEVKIVNFGIAATVDDNLDTQAGSDGKPVGSFPYMSPEQVRHEPLTPASDLFSVGILLWEALAGTKLFARDTAEATLAAVLEADIPAPSTHNPAMPPKLDQIALRALARAPEERYPDASEFHAKLVRFLYSVETPVTANALAALVARRCPPVVREQRPASDHDDDTATERLPAMDATRPMPGREASGSTQTFATHVQFRKVLERATPLLPFDAITDADAALAAAARLTGQTPPGDAPPAYVAPPSEVGAPVRPLVKRGWIALLAALAASAAIVIVLFATRYSPGLSGRSDAGAPDGRVAVTLDGSTAALASDAAHPPADATPTPTPDARRPRRPRPDASADRLATGKIKVGVKPWAEVYVDGKKIGDAPAVFDIAPGRHQIRIVHDGQERTFAVQVTAGETSETPFVNFSSR